MIKKIVSILICLFLLTGCKQANKKEVITFSSWGSLTEVSILKNIISNFEKENPNIQIQFMHVPQNYFQKLHLLFASNTAPDVLFINNLYLPIFADHLVNLNQFINKGDFYPQAIDSLSLNNKLFAIPRDVSNYIVYINTDIITPKTNWDIEDFLETSILAKNKNVYGINFEEDIFWVQPYLAYYGESFDERFNPQASKGLLFYKNLREKYKVAPTKSQQGSYTSAQMFIDQKLAMYVSGRWMYPKIMEKASFNWEIKEFPKGKNNIPSDASGWAISKNSKSKDSALKFILYMSDEKNSKYFADTGLIIPARISTAKCLNNKAHNEKAFLKTIEDSSANRVLKNYKKIADKFNKEIF